jgi:CRP/FNR family transcriptional regulator, cyclic AMP receptor protein
MEQGLKGQGLVQGHDRLFARLESCGLPQSVIEALFSRHTLVRYPKGSPLFDKGSPADVVFVVLSGIVKIYCARAGARTLVELAGPGDLAGYADFSEKSRERSQLFDAEALSNSCVALITRDHVLHVLRKLEPDLILTLAENVNSLWAAAVYRYARFLGMTLRERLEVIFAEMAERFGVTDARGILITPELEQEGLAEMIGGSRPMVSKLLMEMKQEGVIAREGKHYIVVSKSGEARATSGRAQAASPSRLDSGAWRYVTRLVN